ncbi:MULTISPECIES: transposase family protein [Azospirillum]|uniref:transposase family protein n=1 Tax=Azospirillum TaxID=191 RepID=UPI001FCE1BB0|nr:MULTISPECIES: transposase family protein [Azospirillum]
MFCRSRTASPSSSAPDTHQVPCPRCHAPSSRVHSRYERRLADLPWQGRPAIRFFKVLCG